MKEPHLYSSEVCPERAKQFLEGLGVDPTMAPQIANGLMQTMSADQENSRHAASTAIPVFAEAAVDDSPRVNHCHNVQELAPICMHL